MRCQNRSRAYEIISDNPLINVLVAAHDSREVNVRTKCRTSNTITA